MNTLATLLKHVATSRDGESYDTIRILTIILGLSLVVFSGWTVIALHQAFDALAFGTGAAAILGGGGLGIGAKVKDEPEP